LEVTYKSRMNGIHQNILPEIITYMPILNGHLAEFIIIIVIIIIIIIIIIIQIPKYIPTGCIIRMSKHTQFLI
jgi:hypothetical protein